MSPKDFVFELGMIGKPPELTLIFKDFPGGFIKEHPDQVKKFLDEADVILLAIDTPAMMEAKGAWHEKINSPQMIADLFKAVLRNLDKTTKTKLLIMTPVKCESYVQQETDAKKLLTALKDNYQPLLNLLKTDSLLDKISVTVTPVQTLGSVRFTRIEESEPGEPRFFFRKISPQTAYQPHDVEQILKYTLSFVIKKYLDDMGFFKRIFNQMFSLSKPFEDAVHTMVKDRKESGSFEILQGKDLLKLR